MKTNLLQFYNLRVYKHLTLLQILNTLMCNKLMTSKILVKNSPQIYSLATRVVGKGLPNYVLQKTFCQILTAGNTLQDANKRADELRKQSKVYNHTDINILLDYCAEGYLNNKTEQATYDANADMFTLSAKTLVVQKNQMSSIKITGLVDMELLIKKDKAVVNIHEFWDNHSVEGTMTAKQMFEGLQHMCSGVSQENLTNYLKIIHGFKGDIKNFSTDQVAFKMNHHPFYLDLQKNQDFVVNLFLPLSKQEKSKGINMIRRLEQLCRPCANNSNGFRILIDAEQSYVQRAIQSISQQLQACYNKDKVYILPTIQNYLKTSVNRTKYEIEIAKRRKLKFGAKLVRGAYIIEETKLAEKEGHQNPVVDGFDKTTDNYLQSLELILQNYNQQEGEVIVATHNYNTIKSAKALRVKYPGCLKMSFAQLLGLADHLTWQLKQKGETVYKLLPWAKTDVMIPYMIRRAEELQQMRYPLDIQKDLLLHELKSRYH